MHPAAIAAACCCPCYPRWVYLPDSSGGPTLDSSGNPIAAHSIFFHSNPWGGYPATWNVAPVPQYIRLRIMPPPDAASSGGATSVLDRRAYDVPFVSGNIYPPGETLSNDLICSQQLEYCGKFAIDEDVELLDGSGTVHIDTLHIRIYFRAADWGAMPVICDSPRPVIEVWVWADIGSESVFLFAGTQTGDTTPITSLEDGWIYEPTIGVGWPTPPPTTVIFYPPLFDPGAPVLVSPRATDSGGSPGGSYEYPERNRTLLLSCSRRKEHTEDLECGDGEGEPPSYETSSYWGTSSYGGTSGGVTSGGGMSSGGSGGTSSGGSTSGGTGPMLIHPRLCGTGEYQTDLLVDFVGKDDGQVYKHSDGRCVYLDLQDAEVVEGVENLDTSNPQVSCADCSCLVDIYWALWRCDISVWADMFGDPTDFPQKIEDGADCGLYGNTTADSGWAKYGTFDDGEGHITACYYLRRVPAGAAAPALPASASDCDCGGPT